MSLKRKFVRNWGRLGMISNSWLQATLGELAEYMARGIAPQYSEEFGIVVLNQKCIRDFEVSLEPSRFHDISKNVSMEKRLRKYDVLINSTGVGTAGRVAQWMLPIEATCDSHVTIVRPDSKKIDARYLGYAIKAQQQLIESFAEGSTGQTEMNKQRLSNEVVINYPEDVLVQQKIAGILFDIDEKIKINTAINENLAA